MQRELVYTTKFEAVGVAVGQLGNRDVVSLAEPVGQYIVIGCGASSDGFRREVREVSSRIAQ